MLSDPDIFQRPARLFTEPRCHFSFISAIGVAVGATTALGAIVAGVGVIAGVTSAGVSIAAATGAFAPGSPAPIVSAAAGDSSIGAPAVTLQIQNLSGDVAAQNATIATLTAANASQKNLEYIALALGVASVVLALVHNHNKK